MSLSFPFHTFGVFVFFSIATSNAAVIQLSAPAEIPNGVTINFDGYPDYTVANNLFQAEGLSFTRDDGAPIYIENWTSLGRLTTSPEDVLATIRNVMDPIWSTHLNVISAAPLFALGAYFGNDQWAVDFSKMRMCAYSAEGDLLGCVERAVNNNTDVDQFIGLSSDTPFVRVRFENLAASGAPSDGFSVVLDDLIFATAADWDSDGDGVIDSLDDCPATPTGSVVDAQGCSIDQLCPCDGAWKNHGDYVAAVAQEASRFLELGLITSQERAAIMVSAAKSTCGKAAKGNQ